MSLTLPKGIVLAAAAVVSLVVPIATGAVAARTAAQGERIDRLKSRDANWRRWERSLGGRCWQFYSVRSATIGSTRPARRAGT